MSDYGTLMNYRTNETIRLATAEEQEESRAQADFDGGSGVIVVEIDGEEVRCYVQD